MGFSKSFQNKPKQNYAVLNTEVGSAFLTSLCYKIQ